MKMMINGLATVLLLAVAACASRPNDPAGQEAYDKADDPAEPTNRKIFACNMFVDRHVLKPVARAYDDYIPTGVRRSVHNFGSNLGEPAVLVNDLLQGNVSRAWTTAQRFVVDSTAGGAGLFDPATGWALPHHSADFGQTLGVWGIGPGPSVQLPLVGFSNVRDTIGRAAGAVADPLAFIPGNVITDVRIAGGTTSLVDTRAELLPTTDSLEKTSLDYYASLRSLWAQRRANLIEEGEAGHGNSVKPSRPDPADTEASISP